MSEIKALRDQLAELDKWRAVETGAESVRRTIRLGYRPVARRGLLGFLRSSTTGKDEFLTRAETDAVYDALSKVMDDARARAAEVEKQITGEAS